MAVLRQIWCMSAVYFMFLSTGLTTTGPFKENANADQYMPFISWSGIFTIVGYVTSSLMMDILGRKVTYILGILSSIISSLLNIFALEQLEVVEQALYGLSHGSTVILGLIIIGEYTSPKHRSIFLNITTASTYMGVVIGKILLDHVQWTTTASLVLTLNILSLAITVTWPESPYWLALKGLHEDCMTSFDLLRGSVEKGEKKVLMRKTEKIGNTKFMENLPGIYKTCLKFDFKPVTIVMIGAILVEASGKRYLPLFADSMITAANYEGPLENLYTSICMAISSVFLCFLVGTFKNRRVLFASGFASVVAMFLGSIYMILSVHNIISSKNSWIFVSLVALQVIFSNLGATSIPIALIGEVFPLEHKVVGTLLAGLLSSTISWTVMKITVCLLASFHVYGTMAIFGLLMTICLLMLMVILPETNGRTLLQIEEYIIKGQFRDEECDDDEDVERSTRVSIPWMGWKGNFGNATIVSSDVNDKMKSSSYCQLEQRYD